jgi:dihydroorotase
MIDPHVHLRDWNESQKETVQHGLTVAYNSGLSAVFEMPNTNPAMITRDLLEKRIALADDANVPIFHGVYAGLTADTNQIEEIVQAHRDLFPRVVGFKLFAGKSTGNLSVPEFEKQKEIFSRLAQLDYRGVLVVHCEKESAFRPELWNPAHPLSHSQARPPMAELLSVQDMLNIITETGFQGHLHIAHISTDVAVKALKKYKESYPQARISCGATPHHLFMSTDTFPQEKAILAKVNPPLRHEQTRQKLFEHLLNGDIDWIESDHAPHTKEDKYEKYASGMPGLPIYYSLRQRLVQQGVDEAQFQKITHENITRIFNLPIENRHNFEPKDCADDYWGWIY